MISQRFHDNFTQLMRMSILDQSSFDVAQCADRKYFAYLVDNESLSEGFNTMDGLLVDMVNRAVQKMERRWSKRSLSNQE